MPSNQRRKNTRSPKGIPVRRHNYSDIRPRKKKTSLFGPVLILFVLAIVLSLIVAAAWQKLQDSSSSSTHSDSSLAPPSSSSQGGNGPASPSSIPSMKAAVSSETSQSQESSQPDSSDGGAASGESSPAPESSSGTDYVPTSTGLSHGVPVPVSQKVDISYFDDAMFIGDSITDGISIFAPSNNATVIANTGINPSTMLTSKVFELPSGETVTLLDAAKEVDAKKIYIMIGANGISWIGKESFINQYSQIVQRLKEDHPEAIIYVQSILPVTKARSDSEPTLSNLKIDDYNASLLEMTQELEVYYLNVAEAIKDSTGSLPHEASPNDGIHFGAPTYQKWFDYLMTHVVNAGSYTFTSSSRSGEPSQSSSSGDGN